MATLEITASFDPQDWRPFIKLNHHYHKIDFSCSLRLGGVAIPLAKDAWYFGIHSGATTLAAPDPALIYWWGRADGAAQPRLFLEHSIYTVWGAYNNGGTWLFAQVKLDLDAIVATRVLNMSTVPEIYNWNTSTSGGAYLTIKATPNSILRVYKHDQMEDGSLPTPTNLGALVPGYSAPVYGLTANFNTEAQKTVTVDATGIVTVTGLEHSTGYVASCQEAGKDESFATNVITTSSGFNALTHTRQYNIVLSPTTTYRNNNGVKEQKYNVAVNCCNNIPTGGTVTYNNPSNFRLGNSSLVGDLIAGGVWLAENGKRTVFVYDDDYPQASGILSVPRYKSMRSISVDVAAVPTTTTVDEYSSHAEVVAGYNEPQATVTYAADVWGVGGKVWENSTIGECNLATTTGIVLRDMTEAKSYTLDSSSIITAVTAISTGGGGSVGAKILEPAINSGKVVTLDSTGNTVTGTLIDIDTTQLASRRVLDNQWANKNWKNLAALGLSTSQVTKQWRAYSGNWQSSALDVTLNSKYDGQRINFDIRLIRNDNGKPIELYTVIVAFNAV